MVRIELCNQAYVLTVQGPFAEAVAMNTGNLMVHGGVPKRLVVNLSEITFVDPIGETVLSWLAGTGANFVAEGKYATDVCTRLHLPLAPFQTKPHRER
jgi:uracil-DNA glycosylase